MNVFHVRSATWVALNNFHWLKSWGGCDMMVLPQKKCRGIGLFVVFSTKYIFLGGILNFFRSIAGTSIWKSPWITIALPPETCFWTAAPHAKCLPKIFAEGFRECPNVSSPNTVVTYFRALRFIFEICTSWTAFIAAFFCSLSNPVEDIRAIVQKDQCGIDGLATLRP